MRKFSESHLDIDDDLKMSPPPTNLGMKPLPVWKSFGASAAAACTAELLTIPLDTAKVIDIFDVPH